MNINIDRFSAELLAVLTIIASCALAIFWMVVGWRAMRAHEKIAEHLSDDLAEKPRILRIAQKKERSNESKSFRNFLEADPLAQKLDTTEQMRRFAEWKNEQK